MSWFLDTKSKTLITKVLPNTLSWMGVVRFWNYRCLNTAGASWLKTPNYFDVCKLLTQQAIQFPIASLTYIPSHSNQWSQRFWKPFISGHHYWNWNIVPLTVQRLITNREKLKINFFAQQICHILARYNYAHIFWVILHKSRVVLLIRLLLISFYTVVTSCPTYSQISYSVTHVSRTK
jgi:hypothetical protein